MCHGPDTDAQHHIDITSAQHRADLLAAFWHRLKEHRIPVAVRRDWIAADFHSWLIADDE